MKSNPLKSLIIGSNSFVANELLKLLSKKGHEVYGCSRQPNKYPFILSDNNFRQLDITNKPAIDDFIRYCDPDNVFFLAAEMNRDPTKIKQSIETNVIGLLNVLEPLKSRPLTRLVYLCTGELYNGKIPYIEENPLQPKSPYSLSKYQGTLLLQYYIKTFNLNASILRPSIIYGPGQTGSMFIPDVLSNLCQKKVLTMTKGEQTRDFVYSSDMATAMLTAATHPAARGETFNISSGEEIQIGAVADTICSILEIDKSFLSKTRPHRDQEQMRYALDNTKAKTFLGWKPTISLQQGLKNTIDWYQKYAGTN